MTHGTRPDARALPPLVRATIPPPRQNRRSGPAIRRLSPLLLPAAVLIVLAFLLAPGAQPAEAQTTVWSATLTVRDLGGARYGCDNSRSGNECSSALTDDGFTYDGVDYEVTAVNLRRGTLIITLDTDIPAEMNVLTLLAGGTSLNLADNTSATYNSAAWNRTGLDWSEGDTVSLSLREPPPQVFPDLDRLPVDTSQQRPAHQRGPYCYIGEGNSKTEYIRYPDGRIAETTRQSDGIRSMFACD